MHAPVVPVFGDGGGGAGVEPAAGAAVDANGEPAGGDFARLPGKAGGFFVDDSGGQHAGEPCGGGPAGGVVASMAGKLADTADGEFSGGDVFVLRAVRIAAEDVVPDVPEPAVPGRGRAVPVHSPGAVAAGGTDDEVVAGAVALDGRKDVHGKFVREPRGDAAFHAGI